MQHLIVGEVDAAVTDAALGCFGRYGIAKTTMDDVAREAGISRATLYRQVESREALLHATIRAEARRITTLVEEATSGVAETPELLAAVLGVLAAELAEHEVLHNLLETEPEQLLAPLSEDQPYVLEMISSYCGPAVRRSIAAGELDRADADATVDYVSRMLVLFAVERSDRVDLATAEGCRDVVANEILTGWREP